MNSKQSIYLRLYNHIPKELKKRVWILIPFLSLTGALEVVSLAALIPLMSFILEPNNNVYIINLLQLNEFSNSEKVILLFGVYLCLMIVKGIFVFLTSKFALNTSLKIKVNFQQMLFKMYLYKGFMGHLESNSANYIRNITTECNNLEGRLIMPIIVLMSEILPLIFVVLFLLYINPEGVIVAAIVFITSGFLVTYLSAGSLKKYGKEQLDYDGFHIKIAKESFEALKEINLYKRQEKIMSIYSNCTNLSIDVLGKAMTLGLIPKLILELVGLIVIATIASISLAKGADVNQIIVELTVFLAAIIKLLPSVNRFVVSSQTLTYSKPTVKNIIYELESSTKQKQMDDKILLKVKFENVHFKNVNFKYKNRHNYILNGISLKFNRGDIIGLEGESGSGKSTFVNLLLGFVKPSSGQIMINDIDINQCSISWQSKISYVPQDVVLFDDTLKNNILFYDNIIDNIELNDILISLKLDELVSSLPEALETRIGECGSFLSGGQKQRIGIARALARKPELLILDEATSALDIETERYINQIIKTLSLNCTILIIAHKQSAFEICDKVYKIENKFLKRRVTC